jgi:hypothetical protein
MTNRRNRLAVGGVALVAALSIAALQRPADAPPPSRAPVITDTARLPGPRQPIFFRHDIHAGQDQIPCAYCHNTVTVSSEPGIPAVQTCLGCHSVIQGSTETHQTEIQKVLAILSDQKPPQWARIHTLPSFVRFPHQRHVKVLGANSAGCATCHGEVATMPQVYQTATLRMGWCISCHVERKVNRGRDCTICHY